MKRMMMKIQGMVCPNCVMTLERIEDKVDGVIRAEANYHRGQMVVEYDEALVSEDQIKAAVRQSGYEVIPSSK